MGFDEIAAMLEDILVRLTGLEAQMQTAEQVISEEGLSDIDSNLGLLTAGELRFGLGFPGKPSFTGIRLASTGMTYGSTDYLMAGVDSDALLWGVRSCDGALDQGAVSFFATMVSSDVMTTGTTEKVVPLASVLADNQGGWDTGTNLYTAPKSGVYVISIGGFSNNHTEPTRGTILINGDTDLGSKIQVRCSSQDLYGAASLTINYPVSKGETIGFYQAANSEKMFYAGNTTYMSIYTVGD